MRRTSTTAISGHNPHATLAIMHPHLPSALVFTRFGGLPA